MLILGLISGTSVDGIDAALVDIQDTDGLSISYIDGVTIAYDFELRQEILAVADGKPLAFREIAALDDRVAHAFADAALYLIRKTGQKPDWIASHGQTVYHQPPSQELAYSVQLGRGATIAYQTGIATISNFRQADIVAGGQGAPLAPILDWLLLANPIKNRVIQNIGGISNVTFLPAQGPNAIGFDNAPGNVLIDRAAQLLFAIPYDKDGEMARLGNICAPLWQQWLQHPFFAELPPKSTGRELFDQHFLQQCLTDAAHQKLTPHDILATITELTVQGILASYWHFLPQFPDEIILCGGGCKNNYLVDRLQQEAGDVMVSTTDRYGISSDFKEAITFALLGYLRVHNRSGNLPTVTGAKRQVPLGEISLA